MWTHHELCVYILEHDQNKVSEPRQRVAEKKKNNLCHHQHASMVNWSEEDHLDPGTKWFTVARFCSKAQELKILHIISVGNMVAEVFFLYNIHWQLAP